MKMKKETVANIFAIICGCFALWAIVEYINLGIFAFKNPEFTVTQLILHFFRNMNGAPITFGLILSWLVASIASMK